MTRLRPAWLCPLLVLAVWAGCGGDESTEREQSGSSSSAGDGGSGSNGIVECDQAPDGTPCGEPGEDRRCVSNVCLRNACGDGVKTTEEECDDANELARDGCDPYCRLETVDAGHSTGEDAGEAPNDAGDPSADAGDPTDASSPTDGGDPTDSGNPTDAGDLTDAGDPTDSGNPTDAGDPPGDAGSDPDKCSACRDLNCRSYLGVDLLAGCFEAVNPEFGANASDPTFIQDCINVITCARANDCAYDEVKQAAGCYCGSNSIDVCAVSGPAADAKCVPQWQAATRSTVNSVIHGRMSILEFPAGWAYNLLACDAANCNSDVTGDCTIP